MFLELMQFFFHGYLPVVLNGLIEINCYLCPKFKFLKIFISGAI